MVEGSEGPLPLLDCQNSLKKRRPPSGGTGENHQVAGTGDAPLKQEKNY